MEKMINGKLIAPCGIDCGICIAYLRANNPCRGCNNAEKNRPKTRARCRLRICRKRKGDFCYACAEFPCARLKSLDNRYQKKYGMSEIKNLEFIKDKGMKKFLERENKKWASEKGVFCVHDKRYYNKE
jgi:hypothetical protein